MHRKYSDNFYDHDPRREEGLFGGAISRFLVSIARSITLPIAESIKHGERYATKRIMALLVVAIGELFLFNGIALMISDIVGSGRWLGYIVIGAILLIIGMTTIKK